MTDLEDKNEWKNCIDITGVRLPTGYYFGASAGTGDLSGEYVKGCFRQLPASLLCRPSSFPIGCNYWCARGQAQAVS